MRRPEFLDRIKSETASAHRELEEALGFAKSAMSEAGLRHHFARLHGFYRVWEPWIASSGLDEAFLAPRRKLPLVAADLRLLGVADPGALPAYPLPFPPADMNRAMGSLYVVEGSTLGGLLIRKWLAGVAWAPAHGFVYFNSYGDAVRSMWLSFQDRLTQRAASGSEEAIIQAANDTFRRLQHWLYDSRDQS
jgi:heme oxygenase